MESLYDERTIDAITTVKDTTVSLADDLDLPSRPDVEAWQKAVEARLIPRLMSGFPLVAAVCGGGSAGKSTLFNALVGDAISPIGGRAGINRRPLIALSASHFRAPGVAEALCEPFGSAPQPLETPDQLFIPGNPLLHYAENLPAGLALLDTPDFDTGAGGGYQNRAMAEQSLGAADVLIYVFTNANYNNRDNTDFIARMLTAVGTRNCFLVYRAYPAFSDQEIFDHAGTVARNLYGDRAGQHVLGVYRAGEDNRVAAGERPVSVVPVGDAPGGLLDALTQLDPREVKGELHRSIFTDVIDQGERFLREARASVDHLSLYLEGLHTVQRSCVQEALGHLPMDAVVRRFSEIWRDTDPTHVRLMRQTGRVVETPVRVLVAAARWFGKKSDGRAEKRPDTDVAAAMEADLVQAANQLRKAAVDPVIDFSLPTRDPAVGSLRDMVRRLPAGTGASEQPTDDGHVAFRIPLHAAMARAQERLRSRNWSADLDEMLARRETLGGLTRQLEAELRRLVDEQRTRMTTFDQIRQTFAAMLNIIPATAAVTYVLHTGDPVGAAGIKVKLAGLFGLNDLYALVAIPATAGMKKADLKQLQSLLTPVARAWLTHKLTAIEALFEEKITGWLLEQGDQTRTTAAGQIDAMAQGLAHGRRVLETSA